MEKINLQNSGIKEIIFTSKLDKLTFLDFSFEISPAQERPEARNLAELDLTNTPNLKELKCFGVQETNLIGTEHLTQLSQFNCGSKVIFPTNTNSTLAKQLQDANKQIQSLQTQLDKGSYWDNIPTPLKWFGAISIILIAYGWIKSKVKDK